MIPQVCAALNVVVVVVVGPSAAQWARSKQGAMSLVRSAHTRRRTAMLVRVHDKKTFLVIVRSDQSCNIYIHLTSNILLLCFCVIFIYK